RDGADVDEQRVGVERAGDGQTPAVEQDERRTLAQTAQVDGDRAGSAAAALKARALTDREVAHDVGEVRGAAVLELLAIDDLDRRGRRERRLRLDARTGHDHRLASA